MTANAFARLAVREWREQRLAVEAAAVLALARVVTLLPERFYFSLLGLHRLNETATGPAPERHRCVEPSAREIGKIVASVARHLPWRSACLQQAVAVRHMLRRRGLSPSICFGVRFGGDVADAHAWVVVGSEVVAGEQADIGSFTLVGRYA